MNISVSAAESSTASACGQGTVFAVKIVSVTVHFVDMLAVSAACALKKTVFKTHSPYSTDILYFMFLCYLGNKKPF